MRLCLAVAVAVVFSVVFSVGASAAQADESLLRDLATTRNFTLGRPSGPRVTRDGESVVFLRGEARSPKQSLYEMQIDNRRTELLLAPEDVASGSETLSAAEKARRERQRVSTRGFTSFQLSWDLSQILVTLSGRLYVVDRETKKARPVGQEGVVDPQFSPDGQYVAFVRDRDLWVVSLATNQERRLTTSKDAAVTNGVAEFVAQEEMDRASGFWWSGDSTELAYEEANCKAVETLHVLNLMEPTSAPDGTRYPRPGKANCDVRLAVIAIAKPAAKRANGVPSYIEWDHTKYPYLASVRWADSASLGAPLTMVVESRDQRDLEVLISTTGRAKTILHEHDDAWLNLDPSVPRWLPDGSAFLWSTEREGAPTLELRTEDGKVTRLTKPEEGYERVAGLDALSFGWTDNRRVFWTGGPDPRDTNLYAVSITERSRQISVGDGSHTVNFSADGQTYVDTRRSDGEPGKTTVYQANGKLSFKSNTAKIEHGTFTAVAEVPGVAANPPFVPKVEYLEVGPRKMWTSLVRPRVFDAKRRYPVLCAVYGGPHARMVRRGAVRYLEQWIADQGFIVVSVDGRGTPRRGREWERAWTPGTKRTFATRIDDQVDALALLGARYPELDLGRVAVEGWSFGGYMAALAVLRRPDFFRAAAAGAPVVDWRDYDTFYTERYLGLPAENQAGYDDSSLLPLAPNLSRPLLLLHGTSDDNVYFMHSLKLADALFRNGRKAELLALPGLTHMVADPIVAERLWNRIVGFLKENLK